MALVVDRGFWLFSFGPREVKNISVGQQIDPEGQVCEVEYQANGGQVVQSRRYDDGSILTFQGLGEDLGTVTFGFLRRLRWTTEPAGVHQGM